MNVRKRYVLSLLVLGILFSTALLTWAYNANFAGGNPSVAGHSSDELNVRIGSTVKTLQQAIDPQLRQSLFD